MLVKPLPEMPVFMTRLRSKWLFMLIVCNFLKYCWCLERYNDWEMANHTTNLEYFFPFCYFHLSISNVNYNSFENLKPTLPGTGPPESWNGRPPRVGPPARRADTGRENL